MATQKNRANLQTDLTGWKTSEVDVKLDPSNTGPELFHSDHNTMLVNLKLIVDDIVESAHNRVNGIPQADVTGLTASLAGKEPADVTILKEADVINNLTSTDVNKPLSANQGKILNDSIGALPSANNDTKLAEGTSDEVTANELRTHLDDSTIHFTEASISHLNILDTGANTHAQIDTHMADATTHFTQAAINHNSILNVGANTHAQIDTHLASTVNPHVTTLTQVANAEALSLTKGTIYASNGTQIVALGAGVDGTVIKANSAQPSGLEFSSDIGETNTGSNVGSGAGIFFGKAGVNFQFRRLESQSDDLTIAENGNKIDLTINPNNIMHSELNGVGSNTHVQIDSHIANVSNPHSVTKTQVGLGNVPDVDATDCDNHVDGITNGVFTLAERTKLSGVATSATANPEQSAIADLSSSTALGGNTGTAGAALSAIGDTSTIDQSGAIMDDLNTLRIQINTVSTKVDAVLAALRSSDIIAL